MYFPVFIDLSQKKVLVVGGGAIASRRVGTLSGFAGHITVQALEISEEIRGLAAHFPIALRREAFSPEALLGMDLVLAATNDPELNCRIAKLSREQGIPVNVCSKKEECDFFFPSVIQRGDLVIGINASGKNHSLVKRTRQELEEFLKK